MLTDLSVSGANQGAVQRYMAVKKWTNASKYKINFKKVINKLPCGQVQPRLLKSLG